MPTGYRALGRSDSITATTTDATSSGSSTPRAPPAYAGGRGTLDPDDVAAVVVEVIESDRPKPRYPVGMVSRQIVGARRVLPTRLWDAALRRQYPTP